ncbi:hypothetical protein BH20PSE1_BH20PSE1_17110 [soil metagenome]
MAVAGWNDVFLPAPREPARFARGVLTRGPGLWVLEPLLGRIGTAERRNAAGRGLRLCVAGAPVGTRGATADLPYC